MIENNTPAPVPDAAGTGQPMANRAYHCQCGRPVFFRNSECLACHTPLGFDPGRATLTPLQPGPQPGTWQPFGEDNAPLLQRCANFETASGCNWMVPAMLPAAAAQAEGDAQAAPALPPPALCQACALNRTIPDLSLPDNQVLWRKVELAKRRLVSQLLVLGLPVASLSQDPQRGLAFDLLQSQAGGPHVLTGHANGIVTLNIEEADDATREKARAAMREPYRTLLGHFRHEIGHYYWDRLVRDGPLLDECRALFGDERQDYAAALQRNYSQGPAPDWPLHFVTSYASTHPWEDWAESWAHYLHMADTVDTALSFGVNAQNVDLEHEPFDADSLWQPDAPDAQAFLDFLNGWIRLTNVLNELSRSMGQPDFYPFVLPRDAVAKLQFIHRIVTDARTAAASPADAPPVPQPQPQPVPETATA